MAMRDPAAHSLRLQAFGNAGADAVLIVADERLFASYFIPRTVNVGVGKLL